MRQEFEQEYLQLGLKIAYYRKLRGLTQEELAERIDRSPGLRRPCGGAEYQKSRLARHPVCHRAGTGCSGIPLPDF